MEDKKNTRKKKVTKVEEPKKEIKGYIIIVFFAIIFMVAMLTWFAGEVLNKEMAKKKNNNTISSEVSNEVSSEEKEEEKKEVLDDLEVAALYDEFRITNPNTEPTDLITTPTLNIKDMGDNTKAYFILRYISMDDYDYIDNACFNEGTGSVIIAENIVKSYYEKLFGVNTYKELETTDELANILGKTLNYNSKTKQYIGSCSSLNDGAMKLNEEVISYTKDDDMVTINVIDTIIIDDETKDTYDVTYNFAKQLDGNYYFESSTSTKKAD